MEIYLFIYLFIYLLRQCHMQHKLASIHFVYDLTLALNS